MRVDAGADRGSTEVDLADQVARLGETLLVLAEHHGVGREFRSQRHRHCILQLRAAHFQDVPEFVRLVLEGVP